jgi:hypothetical protein
MDLFKLPPSKNTHIQEDFVNIPGFCPEDLSKFINGLNLKSSTGKG